MKWQDKDMTHSTLRIIEKGDGFILYADKQTSFDKRPE
jgi:hypothetical protein